MADPTKTDAAPIADMADEDTGVTAAEESYKGDAQTIAEVNVRTRRLSKQGKETRAALDALSKTFGEKTDAQNLRIDGVHRAVLDLGVLITKAAQEKQIVTFTAAVDVGKADELASIETHKAGQLATIADKTEARSTRRKLIAKIIGIVIGSVASGGFLSHLFFG